nr:type II secretion system inner membrane protein GspF [Oceanococcus sp. HetDA_MAG_MS8]
MAAFSYSALDSRGRKKKGLLEGDTAKAVRGQLRDKGLTPLEVTEVAKAEQGRSGGGFRFERGLPATTVALFTRQLATLVRSGLPLEEALSTAAEQMEGRRVQAVVMGIRARVTEGHTLASALRDYKHIFNEMYCATVESGESSGRLDMVLERLAEYVERRQELQKKIFAALSYPVILVFASIAIVSFLLASVVPQVVGVFASLDAELPPLTKAMIAASDGLRENWVVLVSLVALFVVGWSMAMRRPHLKNRWHRAKLRIPMIGKLERGVNAGRFTRTFSMLVNSGVPVLEAMQICARVVSNLPMRDAVETAAGKVREGAGIARSLGESKLFPPITLNLIANGESSGELDEMLERAAHNQELEVDTLINAVMGVLGPLLIMGMAGIVLTIVLAIMLPIFDMNQLVR